MSLPDYLISEYQRNRDKSRKPDPPPQRGKSLVNWIRLHGMRSSPNPSLFCESAWVWRRGKSLTVTSERLWRRRTPGAWECTICIPCLMCESICSIVIASWFCNCCFVITFACVWMITLQCQVKFHAKIHASYNISNFQQVQIRQQISGITA